MEMSIQGSEEAMGPGAPNRKRAACGWPVHGLRLRSVVLAAALLTSACSKQVPELMRDAEAYHSKGQNNAAIIQLKNVLKLDSKNVEAYLLIASVYATTGDLLQAENELRTALKLGAAPVRALPELGKVLLEMERYQAVLDEIGVSTDYKQSVRLEADIAILRGRAYLGQGKAAEANTEFLLAMPQKPLDAKLGLAQVAEADGKLDAADQLIDEVLGADSSKAEAWLMKGNVLRVRDKPEEAMAAFLNASNLQRDFVPALLSEASLHLAAGRIDKARETVVRARRIAPFSPKVRFAAAMLALRDKQYDKCMEDLQAIFRVIPGHMPSVLLLGTLFFAMDTPEQAQIALATFLKRHPGNVYARKVLAATLLKKAQPQSAIYVLEPVLAHVADDSHLYGLVAQAYLQTGKIDKAREYYEKAVGLDPKDAKLRTNLGLSRLAGGDVARAVVDLQSALALNPGDFTPEIYLIRVLIGQNQLDKALHAAMALVKRQPDKPASYQLKGAVHLARQETGEARASFERALGIQPTYYPAVASLGQLDLRANNPDGARKRIQALLRLDGRNLDAALALAELQTATGQLDEAILTLKRALIEHPSALQGLLQLAELNLQTDRAKDAVEVAEKAWLIAPHEARVMAVLGRSQLAVGDAQGAINTFLTLIEAQPEQVPALLNLASAYTLNSDLRNAGTFIQKALKLDPRNVEARSALGVFYLNSGRYQDALELARRIQREDPQLALGFALEGDAQSAQRHYAAAATALERADRIASSGLLRIKLHQAQSLAAGSMASEQRLREWLARHPQDHTVRLYLADAFLDAGKRKQAIELYLEVLNANPKHARALNNLASALDEEGDPRALRYAQEAFQADPQGIAADTLGWILVKSGKNDEALLILSRAAAMFPGIPEVRYHFAEALFRTGNFREARLELAAALKSGVDFKYAAEARALLNSTKTAPN